MKIVVVGGSGLIGTKVVRALRAQGHDVVAASPSKGVDATTGRGLAAALAGAEVVVDVANAPSFDDAVVLAFFESAGRNLAQAEREAGVRHHVALSVVGLERLPDSGYFRAKLAQERAIETSGIPWTIVRATQFFEFLGAIAELGADGGAVRVSSAGYQPIAADDVARFMIDAAVAAPRNGRIEIAGPERIALSDAVGRYLKTRGDTRRVIADAAMPYFGARIDDRSLVPEGTARLGSIGLEAWLRQVAPVR